MTLATRSVLASLTFPVLVLCASPAWADAGSASDTSTTTFGTAAVVSVLLPLIMKSLVGKHEAASTGDMRYSNAFRYFSLFCAIVPATICVALLLGEKSHNPAPADWWLGGSLIGLFVVLGLSMSLEAYGVHHHFDDVCLHYTTPWTKTKTLRWVDVEQVRWHVGLKMTSLRAAPGSPRLWVYPLLGGMTEMSKIALRSIPESTLHASKDGHLALQRMAQGHALDLVIGAPLR